MGRGAQLLGAALIGVARMGVRLVPGRVQRALDDRFFGAVFQVTRVTNDQYGPGPPPGSGGKGGPEARRGLRR